MDEPRAGFPDPTLCHVCGSTTFEYVDDSHIRCVECGHGATVGRLIAVADADERPSPVAVSEFEERVRTYEEAAAAVFRGAPFRPYALDGRWSGLRSFGGHGASDGRTTSLTLAFSEGHPWDLTLPEVRVETRIGSMEGLDPEVAAKADAFMFAQQQVHQLWLHTGVLRDDVRRYAFPRDGARSDDPTTAWERALVTVDGHAAEFAVLSEGAHWVAQAIINETVVGIQARHWTLQSTGLVTEGDFEPYERGARAIRRLWTQWAPPEP